MQAAHDDDGIDSHNANEEETSSSPYKRVDFAYRVGWDKKQWAEAERAVIGKGIDRLLGSHAVDVAIYNFSNVARKTKVVSRIGRIGDSSRFWVSVFLVTRCGIVVFGSCFVRELKMMMVRPVSVEVEKCLIFGCLTFWTFF